MNDSRKNYASYDVVRKRRRNRFDLSSPEIAPGSRYVQLRIRTTRIPDA